MAKSAQPRPGRLDRRERTPALPQAPKRGRPQRVAHLVADREQAEQQARAAVIRSEALTSRAAPLGGAGTAPINAATPTPRQDVLCLAQPDWVCQTLTVSGPSRDVAAFRAAARGTGRIPWTSGHACQEEDVLHYLLAPPPAERGVSVQGARIIAQRICQMLEALKGRTRRSAGDGACPFDLHVLLPVPASVLRLGPDDPAALAWLWKNWGTTWSLRRVEQLEERIVESIEAGHDAACYRFWSADWTPWQAVAALRTRWSTLTLHVSLNGGDRS